MKRQSSARRQSCGFVRLVAAVALAASGLAVSGHIVDGSDSTSGRNWALASTDQPGSRISVENAIRVVENGLSEQTDRRVEFS
ncbi:hypothetical protein GCM10009557_36780 [Virgisporangium ochraceum]|uniref:Uncharacterized protein n=1 Tax=Virgisporangium ochraceum TaxID=65505 RepID=A0A8J4EEH6_9ACTN|nr:hypothetical protein [Virgisporangium ochraceum]GIJ71741.1 hypothetical protein Voc01_066580 [Virgisporangium ochraceum]